MKKLFSSLFLTLLIFLAANANASENYTAFQHRFFTIHIPSTWHRISKEYLNDFFAEQAKKQGLSVDPNWLKYECGFQEKPLSYGISLPLIAIKIDTNQNLSHAILKQFNTMTQEQISFTYSSAVKELASEVSEMLESSVKGITLDRKRRLLRFTISANNVQSLTSIYAYNNKVFHIICSTPADTVRDIGLLRHISDTFTVKQEQSITKGMASAEAEKDNHLWGNIGASIVKVILLVLFFALVSFCINVFRRRDVARSASSIKK